MRRILVALLICMITLTGVVGVANAAAIYTKEKAEAVDNGDKKVFVPKQVAGGMITMPSIAVLPILTDLDKLPKGTYDQINNVFDDRVNYPEFAPVATDKVMAVLKEVNFEKQVNENGLTDALLEQIRRKLGADMVISVYIKDVEEDFNPNTDIMNLDYRIRMLAVSSWKAPVTSDFPDSVQTEYLNMTRIDWSAKQLSLAVDRFLDKVLK